MTSILERAHNDSVCSLQLRDSNINKENQQITIANNRIASMNEPILDDWSATKYWDSNWINIFNRDYSLKMQKRLMADLTKGKNISSWFIFDTTTKHYRCRHCRTFLISLQSIKNITTN